MNGMIDWKKVCDMPFRKLICPADAFPKSDLELSSFSSSSSSRLHQESAVRGNASKAPTGNRRCCNV